MSVGIVGICRGDRIRTCGLPLPKRALYQAELRPGGSGATNLASPSLAEAGEHGPSHLCNRIERHQMVHGHVRGCSSMVEPQFSKLMARVRFPSSPPHKSTGGLQADAPSDPTLSVWPTSVLSHRPGRARGVSLGRRAVTPQGCRVAMPSRIVVVPSCVVVTRSRVVVHGLDRVVAVVATVALLRELFGADGPMMFGCVYAALGSARLSPRRSPRSSATRPASALPRDSVPPNSLTSPPSRIERPRTACPQPRTREHRLNWPPFRGLWVPQ